MNDAQQTRMLLAVGLTAFVLRLLNTQALLADPLFYSPLGGNTPLLEMAERIAGGDWVPDGAFTVNSPLYPYVLALIYKVFGVGSYYAVRMVSAAVDTGTCVLVALLAARHFGTVAGWGAGLLLAAYAPSIFFAAELAPVSYTLFLLVAAVLLMDGRGTPGRFVAAGLVLGLATGMRPNLLLAGLMALAVPAARALPNTRRLTGALAVGLVVGLAPVTMLNVAGSGGFTLLTLSGGHNLFIGHNAEAQAQYSLPASLDGDIFESMKALAEDVEGRTFAPEEVSGYYSSRAVRYALTHPLHEIRLTAKRALLLANDFEATTYANLDYQRSFSAVLRWTPTFAWLLALAVPGMLLVWQRRRLHLWIPLLAGAITVLAFFYIARLRVLMVPSLALFAGAAIARAWEMRRGPTRTSIAIAGILVLLGFGVAKIPLLESDTSNDWNKAGGVLLLMERYPEAEAALARARTANPENPSTYLNLATLYRRTGRVAEGEEAQAEAMRIIDGAGAADVRFREAVEGGR